MGTNGGSGGLGDAGGMMGNNANQPPTTEYTLQGWCRHEARDGDIQKADVTRAQV